MPVLARLIGAPLVVDIRRGAADDLTALLADGRISAGGRVAVATSTGSGSGLADRLRGSLPRADWFTVAGGSIDAATRLTDEVRSGAYDALVGIGGGRVLDVAKFAAARVGLPMVSVATNLAHDGIASPVSILDNDAGRGSYGVPAPVAVVVDLDAVRQAPPRYLRAGIGEVLSNLSAVADWELARQVTGEAVDGLAVTIARTAGASLLRRDDGVESDDFLVALAEALVLSGLAMIVAGTSRPCSGACHEISHALDALYREQRAPHGEQVGVGACFATYLRGDGELLADLVAALRRNRLPVLPADLGLSDAQFAAAVLHAPDTRPGRYTVLEHRGLDSEGVADAVAGYAAAVR